MANQQLIDYIKQQLTKGASKDVITTALKGAGWLDSDITEAFSSASPAPTTVSSAAVQAKPTTSFSASPVSMGDIQPASASSSPTAKTASSGVSFNVSEGTVQGMGATRPATTAMNTSPSDKKMTSDVSQPFSLSSMAHDVSGDHAQAKAIMAGMAAAILVLAGAAGFFYKRQADANARLSELSAQNDQLSSQTSSANQKTEEQIMKLTVASDAISTLKKELSLFVAAGTSTQEVSITLKGMVTLAGTNYILTTSNGSVVALKNGKDAKIAPLLQPVLGTPASISGTYVPGKPQLTVTGVNGASVQ